MPRFNSLRKLLVCFGPCRGMPKSTSITVSQSCIEKGTNVENKNLKDSLQATLRSPIEEKGTTLEKEGLKDCSDDMTESFMPLDVMLEILSRLPVKPLTRCKCVCKLWRSAIEDRKFTEKHMRRNGRSFRYQEVTSGDANKVICYWVLDGLVLDGSSTMSHNNFFLRNPATGQKVKLPDLHKGTMDIKFSHIHTSNSYKLVCVHAKVGRENGGCKVLALGTDPTWRSIDIPSLHSLGSPGELLHSTINDEVFFLIRFTTTDSGVPELIYLDLASETFGHIKAPPVIFKNREKVSPVHWENKFALAYHVDEEMHFWVLEDYKKQKWAKTNIAFPSNFLGEYPDLVKTPLLPHSVKKGVLHFHCRNGYYVRYHIASKKAFLTAPPPGKKLASTGYNSIVRIPEINQGRK